MAATDALWLPLKNGAWRVTGVIKNAAANGNPLTGGLTSLAATISKDGSAFASTASAPTEIGTSGFFVLDLTASEMNCTSGAILVTAGNTDAIYQTIFFSTANLSEFTGRADAQDRPTFESYIVQLWMIWMNKERFDVGSGTYTRYLADSTTTAATASGSSDPTQSTRGKAS